MKAQKKSKKTLFITMLSILAIIIMFVFTLPMIISSNAFNKSLIERIERDTSVKIEVRSMNFTWFGPQMIKGLKYSDPNMDLDADLIISNMSLFSFYKAFKSYKKLPFIAHTKINNLNLTFHFPNMPIARFHSVNADITSDHKGINSIEITGKTTEDKYAGNFDVKASFKEGKVLAHIQGTSLPTIGLDHLLFYNNKKMQGSLLTLLGPSTNLIINATIENAKGPISVDISSTNSKFSFDLMYEKNEITLLNSAFGTFHINTVEPDLVNGIDFIKSYPNSPVVLKISSGGFFLPLSPFKLQKLKINHAFIDFGRLIVSNTGAVASITNIARMRPTNNVSMWFTPVNVKIEGGMAYTDRMDVLINDSLHICLWGTLDLVNQRFKKAYLGLTADTLEDIFGLKNLDRDYVIKIPIKGSFQRPKIDAKKVGAKILALSALQSGKGIAAIIGGVITKFQKGTDIPPAKRPFPWEGKVPQRRRKEKNPQIDINNIIEMFKK